MRTLIVLVIGAILSAAFVYAANTFARNKSAGVILFLMIWLIVCAIDFARGVKAGYSVAEELGIHALLFVVPAAVALCTARFLR
jgi:hypothetical protein